MRIVTARSSRRMFAAIACLILSALPRLAHSEEATFTILHTTDIHGSLLPWDDLADKPAARGLTRVATLIKRARAEGQSVLLLDAGDATAGSPLTSVWHAQAVGPEPVTLAMNALAYDAMAVGNHEFDFGPAGMALTRGAAHFPWLSANIAAQAGSEAFAPSLVKTLPNGIKVGVIGLTTPAVPQLADSSRYAGYGFASPIDAAKREVARLRETQHCDVVVALVHAGFEEDPKSGEKRVGDAPGENFAVALASQVTGLDVILMGHTHVTIGSQTIGGALVTQAGKWAEGLGRVDLTLARAYTGAPWAVTARRAQVIAVTDSVPADTSLTRLLAPYAAATKAAMLSTICDTRVALTAPGGRFADNPLWQFIHRAQLEASGADVSLAAMFDPTQSIPAGPVHLRDIMRLYPYDNTLVVVKLTGAEIKEALEQSARYFKTYTFDDQPLTENGYAGYNFDMAAGVSYDVDLTQAPGSRIVNLAYKGARVTPEQTFKVAVNSYRANGGGGFAGIAKAPKLWRSSQTLPELLIASARNVKTLPARWAPSWTLLPDYAWTPERPLIDRAVRLGVLPRGELMRLGATETVKRVDLAYWLGRAFDWRSKKPSGAYGDVADSLQPWIDGVLAKGVLGADGRGEDFQPYQSVNSVTALTWAEAAARAAGYSMNTPKPGDVTFWKSLTQGVSLDPATGTKGGLYSERLTRAQWLGMIANLRLPQVRVLETTDFHGVIFPSKDRRTGRMTGGTVGLATQLQKLRAENPTGTVLIDGGDLFQGTMISNLQFGRPVVEQMNLLGYSAAAIGNHEFDWTADTLKARVLGMHFAALGANMIERKSGKRPWWVRSDTTVLRRGVKVGILGLCYPGTPRVTLPANVAHLTFRDDSTTASEVAPRLRKTGASVVVEVGHIPAETDSTRKAHGDLPRLANGVPGIDAFFGGHSHNVVDDRINGKPVMISGAHGQYIAMVDFIVDPVAQKVLEMKQRMVTVYADDPGQDSTWLARVDRWNANVAPVSGEHLGVMAKALDRHRPESTIGDWICDAMRFSSGADIAMQNPGGMRADHPAGEITRGSVYEVMPFDNTIVTMKLTGAAVKLALEQALKFDRVTQVSGIKYTVDQTKPAGSRVLALSMADGSAMDDTKLYKVAVNNFMATGGDNYDALGNGLEKTESGLVIRGAMEAYVRDRCKGGKPLEVTVDGRVTQTGGRE